MVIFDQLRISDDGKKLFLNAHVNAADYFSNIYIDTITIKTSDTVGETPECLSADGFIYKKVLSGNNKNIDIVLDGAAFTAAYNNWNPSTKQPINDSNPYADTSFDGNLSGHLLFVYIKCKTSGAANACFESLPCSMQEMTTVGVTFDTTALYQRVMGYTRELADSCEIPKNFIDFILGFNAFQTAVETEHFVPAIQFYNQLFNIPVGASASPARPCGCR